MIMGLDIGGANTKAGSADGSFVKSVYLPLWKGTPLAEVLREISGEKPAALGVVMTGELADCYKSKLEGIESIMGAVRAVFACPISFWGSKGFQPGNLMELAAANWSASASLIAQDIGDCLFVDMGSTTTDLIPIRGEALAASSDYMRLRKGELVYSGLLRTSLGALMPSVRIDDADVPTSPELFAITADAYLALGEISEDQYACDAPDGAGKDPASVKRRLARLVCADLEELGEDGAMAIAEQVRERQIDLLVRAIYRQSDVHGLDQVAAAGIGERVIAHACDLLGFQCIRLSERYGKRISDIFPAYAVARLLADQQLKA